MRTARRNRPALIAGIAASVLMHGVVVAVWRGASFSPDALAADVARQQTTELRVIELPPVPQPETAEPAVEAPSPSARPRPVEDFVVSEVAVSVAAPEIERVELEPAEGLGRATLPAIRGGGSVSGAFDPIEHEGPKTLVVSRARSVLRTWQPPASVMGLEMKVRVHIDEKGRPTGSVELLPPTPDDETNDELIYRARTLEYWPATEDGEPVAGWAEISYRFCYDGVAAASPPSPSFGKGDPCSRQEGVETTDSTER